MRAQSFPSIVILALGGTFGMSLSSLSQQFPGEGTERQGLEATWFVSCLDANGKNTGSRLVRSPLLVSALGAQAFVEVKVIARKNEAANEPECRNTTRVYVRSRESSSPELILLLPPMRYSLGNGVELADWSPDGRYLLMTETTWTYYSDSIGFKVYLYDMEQKLLIPIDYDAFFDRHFIRDTYIWVRAVGFHTDGVSPVVLAEDEDFAEVPGQHTVMEGQELWVIKWQQNAIERLPSDYKTKRFGTIRKAASPPKAPPSKKR